MERASFAGMQYQELRRRLILQEPNIDEDTLADTLEGLTDFHEILAATIRVALVDEALAFGLRDRIIQMEERQTRLEERAAKRRRIVRDVMLDTGVKKIVDPEFTISTRIGSPSVVVVEESQIPEQYWEPQRPRLNRQSILSALKGGAIVPGAALSNVEAVLSVRTR